MWRTQRKRRCTMTADKWVDRVLISSVLRMLSVWSYLIANIIIGIIVVICEKKIFVTIMMLNIRHYRWIIEITVDENWFQCRWNHNICLDKDALEEHFFPKWKPNKSAVDFVWLWMLLFHYVLCSVRRAFLLYICVCVCVVVDFSSKRTVDERERVTKNKRKSFFTCQRY